MNNYLFYALNILLFALPLALFEINLEKANGWGGAFPRDKWYGKSFIKDTKFAKILSKITRFEAPLNYHVVIMFLFLIVFLSELYGTKNIWLVLSCFFGVNFFADVFWFSFNWHFDSLTQLLKGPNGSITWHKGWTKIKEEAYVPTSYIWWLGLSIIFFFMA
ncbi:MAG: hypothetical protein NTX66_00365 [Candidatus Falkowbacteria bacterium]|nr:hypothetical protein [Candidatus Falkowbacteria bacterium]